MNYLKIKNKLTHTHQMTAPTAEVPGEGAAAIEAERTGKVPCPLEPGCHVTAEG